MPSKVTFQVVYSSSSNDNHSEKELEFHSPTSKGWQSSRFCLYPQELVLLLREPTRVRKLQILSHQFLIPSKVEVLISRAPPGQTPSLLTSQFKRLGYVALSSNESTDFKARELKSIHLDFEGNFIKLVLHKNHVNKYNIYNQVGLIAVNIIGDPLEVPSYSQDHDAVSDIIACDEDPETATLIRKLDDKKREAVQLERYDYAKKLTAVISDLYKIGEKLGRYEVEKKRAVELEDYDLAMEKKRQSDEFRLYVYKQLDIQELLEMKGRQPHKPINITPPPLPPIVADHSRFPLLRPEEDSRSKLERHATRNTRGASRIRLKLENPSLPVLICLDFAHFCRSPEPEVEVESPRETAPNSDGPEPLKENDLRTASLIIEVFGEDLVQHAYSKQWKHRQAAMENVDREVTADTPELTADKDARKVAKATVQLIQKGVKDQVFSVFNASLAVLRSLVKNYIPRNKIVKSEISYVAEKVTPLLLTKSGEMVSEYCYPLLKVVVVLFCRSLSTENIMRVVLPALEHTSGEVRDAASRLVIELYKMVKDAVRDYLPPDEPATRKNPLYRNLFDGFDRIDGKPTETERRD
ncbi:PREDICTED: centrosomal protein of 104 kDa-like [Acropora digitifera]|uniref:centrosomal protein of 104 kDa-like n=1 Tax=Acropora digitifera TaxID=70779 RepID=UPI00077A531B|nr:PREDICTED: centrosomal protein of 104 kDa-like [Acropora digitifera]